MSEDFILVTEGLSKEFGGFSAVKNVNLKVRRGAIHALIGPNGAGKTTCFNMLTKFLNPTGGRIIYDGRDITAVRPATYGKLADLNRGIPAARAHWLWDGEIPSWAVAGRVKRCGVIWTVSEHDKRLPGHATGPALPPGPRMARAPAYRVETGYGFHIVERWQFSFAQVTKSTR